jgi:histone deacetylase complex subunit SAP18
MKENKIDEINREKICPFLVKVYYKENEFNSLDDMNSNVFPTNRELYIYTWMDASLRELTILIKDAIELIRKKDSVFNFSFVFPDSKGKLQRKEIGAVYTNKKSFEEGKTLQVLKYTIGDFIDINISPV